MIILISLPELFLNFDNGYIHLIFFKAATKAPLPEDEEDL